MNGSTMLHQSRGYMCIVCLTGVVKCENAKKIFLNFELRKAILKRIKQKMRAA